MSGKGDVEKWKKSFTPPLFRGLFCSGAKMKKVIDILKNPKPIPAGKNVVRIVFRDGRVLEIKNVAVLTSGDRIHILPTSAKEVFPILRGKHSWFLRLGEVNLNISAIYVTVWK